MIAHRHRTATVAAAAGPPERGATLVEAAVALPIFLLLLLGMADVGRGVFQTSQATSGAADGARRAIVIDAFPDVTNCAGDPTYQAIIAEVQARIPGRDLDCGEVDAACVTASGSVIDCHLADPRLHRVRVQVAWDWEPVSPFGHIAPIDRIQGRATMRYVVQPRPPVTTTSVP